MIPSPAPLGLLTAGEENKRETLVFLHGWGGSKESWDTTLDLLGDSYHCVALDLPGTGDTFLPDTVKTMEDMAGWVRDTCLALGLHHVTLVGHSMGGNLAAQVALLSPELVRRLILVDAALEPKRLPPHVALGRSKRYGLSALKLMRLASWPFCAAGSAVPHGHRNPFLARLRRAHRYNEANPDPVLHVHLRALCDSHLPPEELAALTCPILIVHGALDIMVPVRCARELAAALPHARLVIFPRLGHNLMDADPYAFTRTVSDFLA